MVFKPSAKTTSTAALSDRNFNVFKGAGGSLASQEFYPETGSAGGGGNYGLHAAPNSDIAGYFPSSGQFGVLGGGSQILTQHPGQSEKFQSMCKTEICRNWEKGFCQYGNKVSQTLISRMDQF